MTHSLAFVGQQQVIDELKKHLKKRILHLTFFFSLPTNDLDRTNKFSAHKKDMIPLGA